MTSLSKIYVLPLLMSLFFTGCIRDVFANIDTSSPKKPLKIVSLAPHLTEWVYSLGLGDNLLAVSEYSDFPEAAKTLPRIADYQGADIAAIVTLSPDLVLAWDGGNKPQDIQKLSALGLNVFKSRITDIRDIASELIRLGELTQTQKTANALSSQFIERLDELETQFAKPELDTVFYYSWTSPLMTIGPNAWANKLLNICGAQTLFYDSPVDYPQVSVKDVLSRQPKVLIAASKSSQEALAKFWQPHRQFLHAPIITVNPDVTSRFSLRLIDELKMMCNSINP